MSLWLNEEELKELTKATHRQKQIDALNALRPKPKFWVRKEDNRPMVDRWQFMGPEQKAG